MPDRPLDQLGLIQLHLSWYPLMEPRDIYKLLYQGVMGSEHLVASPEDFIRYLGSEFDRLPPDPTERLTEPVRPDQTLLRLNLRSYKNKHADVDALFTPLLESAQSTRGDQAALRTVWEGFVQLCEQGQVPRFTPEEIHQFNDWLERSGYPPVHHSQVYRLEYQPAYRLITYSALQQLGLSNDR